MTSYRRARIMQEKEKTQVSFFQSALIFLKKFSLVAWRCILIVWYILERIILVVLMLGLTVGLAWWLSQKPSLYRDWEPQDAVLPTFSWSGDTVAIKNIRDHTWTSTTEFIPGYYDADFSLDDIEKVYYIITPFSDKDGPAHTMLSFSFSGGRDIVISAELRKERGEGFDALKGILNQFEIQYVVASETDVVKIRTNYRENQVYMYPIAVPKEKIQQLFRSMAIRADKLNREPEFYNTLWNNCTTSILVHANSLRQEKLDGGIFTLLPSHSDEIVYDAGLIDTTLSLTDARAYYRIDEVARSVSGEGDFSATIRKEIR